MTRSPARNPCCLSEAGARADHRTAEAGRGLSHLPAAWPETSSGREVCWGLRVTFSPSRARPLWKHCADCNLHELMISHEEPAAGRRAIFSTGGAPLHLLQSHPTALEEPPFRERCRLGRSPHTGSSRSPGGHACARRPLRRRTRLPIVVSGGPLQAASMQMLVFPFKSDETRQSRRRNSGLGAATGSPPLLRCAVPSSGSVCCK